MPTPGLVTIDAVGTQVNPDDYDHVLGYDGAGNLVTDSFTIPGAGTYTQTLTYTSGRLTGVSKWVKQ
jgi:hypothetical protein